VEDPQEEERFVRLLLEEEDAEEETMGGRMLQVLQALQAWRPKPTGPLSVTC
jgi:hypothetical protein